MNKHTSTESVRIRRTVSPGGIGIDIARHRVLILLALGTICLKSLIFAPLDYWPLSFVCLVPWVLMVGGSAYAPRVYLYSYLMGFVFFLWNMRWMYPATGLGYVALSFYLAVYFPLVACPLRHMVRRRGWRLAFTLPFIWVGSEMLRSVVISGFPWFFLSHSLHSILPLIQISDVVGATGVSFVVAAVNGAIADAIFARLRARGSGQIQTWRRSAMPGIVFAVVLIAFCLGYGFYQMRRDTSSDGPTIALLQGDYLNSVFTDELVEHDRANGMQKMSMYVSMMEAAAAQKPDIYLLPETPWLMFLNKEQRDLYPLSRLSFRALQQHATANDGYVITGSASRELFPYALLAQQRTYNSATVFRPEASEPDRYDKVHLVYFGETLPFRFGRFRFLYLWLNRLMPFSENGELEYSLYPGSEFRVFEMMSRSRDGQTYRFGIPICYEDVMPYVSREFVSGGSNVKQADFLLNISNDGWFGRGVQQPQHLAICVFRAIENRVGIARSVNTGISGFIDPSGEVHDVVKRDALKRWPGNSGFSISRVRVDSRYTLYSRYGDWFSWGCALIWLLLFCDYWWIRARGAAPNLETEQ